MPRLGTLRVDRRLVSRIAGILEGLAQPRREFLGLLEGEGESSLATQPFGNRRQALLMDRDLARRLDVEGADPLITRRQACLSRLRQAFRLRGFGLGPVEGRSGSQAVPFTLGRGLHSVQQVLHRRLVGRHRGELASRPVPLPENPVPPQAYLIQGLRGVSKLVPSALDGLGGGPIDPMGRRLRVVRGPAYRAAVALDQGLR